MSERNNTYTGFDLKSEASNKNYVFDSFAILAFFNNEKGASIVRDLLIRASNKTLSVFISNINFGEIIYIIERELGVDQAQFAISKIKEMPLEIIFTDMAQTLKAANLKTNYPICYTDAFAAALSIIKEAILVTGDRDFYPLGHKFEILWL